ncbi:MAG: vitamin B12/bleomycin/antimicrobial peptide transport system ATP-binding/permease protein [Pseudomonadota bacterium]|nr:vitamin B12/bleomycin/antimicrobial peptide transport system ATP-binding/permease protein [Pseudomonadota bacterium]
MKDEEYMWVNMNSTQYNKQSIFSRNPIYWVKDAWFLAAPYWKSSEKYKSMGLIVTVITFNLLAVYMTVMVNQWYNGFYDAIQRYDKPTFIADIYKFLGLAFLYILFQVLAFLLRKFLEIRWRRWLTRYYLDKWLGLHAYYKTRFLDQVVDNPDQRISEDISSFIVLLLDLSLGLISSVVSLFSFVFILWNISGSWQFTLANHHFVISGYMVYFAVIYAVIGTYITFKIGKPLIKLNFRQQAYEADFRYSLVRVREYGENIAFYNGESEEKIGLLSRFNNVVNNFIAIIYRQMKIDIFSIGYAQLSIIASTVIAAPRYFAKLIQLGGLMQINSAFGRVQDALSYFIGSYTSLSGFRAVMDRLYGFQVMVQDAANLTGLITRCEIQGNVKGEGNVIDNNTYLELNNVVVNLPNGNNLLKNISFSLRNGDRLLIRGRSGIGKTTLLRVIAGLWPFADGEIKQYGGLTSIFIAQRPYLPLGNLRRVLCYPKIDNQPTDAVLIDLLNHCGLTELSKQLHTNIDWGSKLSLGEQQRIAFCRILVNQPDIIYLDEATSALDEEYEGLMYNMLIEALPNSVVISIGHRSTIARWHNQQLDFNALSLMH